MGTDEDDLDAFFDDIEKAEDNVAQEESKKSNEAVKEEEVDEEPPAKKQKTTATTPAVVRPRGVVVAAAASSTTTTTTTSTTDATISDVSSSIPAVSSPYSYNSGPVVPNQHHHQPSHPPPHGSEADVAGRSAVIGPSVGPDATAAPSAASTKSKSFVRTAGGKTWVDQSLEDWPDDDFRIFVGNLANDITDAGLFQHFASKGFLSLQRAKIVRDAGRNHVSKGYGFVSFADALECAKAIRELDQSWLGSRPIRIKKSTWKDRNLNLVRKKEKRNRNQQKRMGLL